MTYRCSDAKKISGHLQKIHDTGVNFWTTSKISGISQQHPGLKLPASICLTEDYELWIFYATDENTFVRLRLCCLVTFAFRRRLHTVLRTYLPTLLLTYLHHSLTISTLTVWKSFVVKKPERFKQLSAKRAHAVHRHNVERLGSAVLLHKVCRWLRLCKHKCNPAVYFGGSN